MESVAVIAADDMPQPDAITPDQRQEILKLLSRLRASQGEVVVRFLQALVVDPVWLSIMAAPPDNEPYTDEQRRADDEAVASIERGEGVSHEEVLREFGL